MRSDRSWRGSNELPVSVIMPALNAGRFIEAAIRSLLREREAVDLDIFVIDDGSSDETRAIVAAIAGDFPEVRLLQNPRKGIAAARNTGLDHIPADCQFVTFLDADDISYPGRISRQRSLLVADPTIDALYGLMRMFTRARQSRLGAGCREPDEDHPGSLSPVVDVSPAVIEALAVSTRASARETIRISCCASSNMSSRSCSTTAWRPIIAGTTAM